MALVINHLAIFTTLLLLLVGIQGYPYFQQRIPNGNSVPYPCKVNYQWYGVGHNNSQGGGVRNAFGEAFHKYGLEWNKCLCEEDSDGDGMTNGEELGDPMCIWKIGETPTRRTRISHPGICEPHDSTICSKKNSWLDCSLEEEVPCHGIDEPGVHRIDINFIRTAVPSTETNHYCMGFNLTDQLPKGDSQLIAVKGNIDNKNVMHHIVLYGCNDVDGAELMENFADPTKCSMSSSGCSDMIALWAIGIDWFCNNDNTGFLTGINGYKYVFMEFHWNNPEFRSDYTDASGLQLYVTENLREYSSGVVFIGPPFIQIPPGWAGYEVHGGCSESCLTNMLSESIYITHFTPHMHYLGTGFTFQIYRQGVKIYELIVDPYFYDDPLVKQYTNPLEVKAGDEIKVTCVYQSKDRDEYTHFGQGTSDEMCYAIIFYYPFQETVDYCGTHNGHGICTDDLVLSIEACNQTSLVETIELYKDSVNQECDPKGLTCNAGCREILPNILTHHCFTREAVETVKWYVRWIYGKKFTRALSSCDARPPPYTDEDSSIGDAVCARPISSAVGVKYSLLIVAMMIFITFVIIRV